ncbi:hypothetical protein ACSBR2_004187 [Camellia fascicularis]
MPQLIQEMGREIVRQESPKEPGECSRLWNHKDSFHVLNENSVRINFTTLVHLYGTRIIEGLILDTNFLKEEKYSKPPFGVNGKHRFEEFHNTSLLSNVGNSFKRHCVNMFSWKTIGPIPNISN